MSNLKKKKRSVFRIFHPSRIADVTFIETEEKKMKKKSVFACVFLVDSIRQSIISHNWSVLFLVHPDCSIGSYSNHLHKHTERQRTKLKYIEQNEVMMEFNEKSQSLKLQYNRTTKERKYLEISAAAVRSFRSFVKSSRLKIQIT